MKKEVIYLELEPELKEQVRKLAEAERRRLDYLSQIETNPDAISELER